METDHRRAAWLAHTTASLTGFAYHAPRKMPPLSRLTGVEPAARPQSAAEQMKLLRLLTVTSGGRILERGD